jgi:hypothetical protein
MKRLVLAVVLGAVGCGACGDDDDDGAVPDAQVDGPVSDAAIPDAAPIDAFEVCPGAELFTGDYRDWVTDAALFDATLTEIGNETNTAATAPNGRGELCLESGSQADVRFTGGCPGGDCGPAADYLALVHGYDSTAQQVGSFFAPGITGTDADALYEDELSLTRDSGSATVMVDVREYPGGTALVGTTVSINVARDGAFTRDSGGVWTAGATITDDPVVLFANAVTGSGSVGITVTPPAGYTCAGRTTMTVEADGVSVTAYSCSAD